MELTRIDNRYEILEKIGAGAMGEVYKVKDLKDDRIVALKILSREKTSSETFLRFKREFQLLTELRHPNLCTVYDFGGVGDEQAYFTMEYIQGSNILAASQTLSFEETYHWVVQLCRVLEYIHAKGLIHYDVKPGNVLVQGSGDKAENSVIKLMDFGLAGEQMLKGGMIIKGTIPYIAPEVVRGLAVDHRADLYSLGVLLYEIFTRSPIPLESKESFVTLLRQRPYWVAEPMSQSIADVPKNISRIIFRLLAYEPADRISRANEVITQINKTTQCKFELETEKTIEGYLLSSRFVDRRKEMNLLESAYEQAQKGQGRVLLITGDTGVGKSRLLNEFKIQIQLKRSYCFVGSAYKEKTAPLEPFYGIFSELVNYLSDVPDRSWPNELRTSLAILTKIFPDLGSESLRARLPRLVPLGAEQERIRNFEALSWLISYVAANLKQLVIILEDLHQADDLSIQFFDYLCRSMDKGNIVVCAAARTEELGENPSASRVMGNLQSDGYLTELHLQPLDFRSLYSFLDSTITPNSNSAGLVQYLVEKTGGNPFFVEEIMRTFLKTKKISIGGSIDITALKKMGIPRRVDDVVSRRLKELNEPAWKVVKFAAILLKGFSFDLMKRLAEFDDTELSRTIWDLQRKQIMIERNNQYQFYHVTLREAVAKRLGSKEKQKLCHKIGMALLSLNQGREEKIIEDLAYYFINAHDLKHGFPYGIKAARKSRERYANDQAIKFYRDVINLIDDTDIKSRLGIVLELAHVEFLSGYYDDATCDFNKILRAKIMTKHQKADIYRRIGDVYRKKPQYNRALTYYQRGIGLLSTLRKNKDIAYTLGATKAGMAYAHLGMGNFKSAFKCNTDALKFLKTIKRKEAVMWQNDIFYNIGIIDVDTGKYAQAFKYFGKALQSNKRLGNDIGVVLMLFAFGYGYYSKGNFEKAFKYYQKSMQLSDKIGNPRGVARAMVQLATILCAKGDCLKALEHLHKAYAISTKIGTKRELALSLQSIGNCASIVCDYETAEKNYERALKYWEDLGIRDNKASTLLDLSSIKQTKGEYSSALRLYERAFEIFRKVGRIQDIALSQVRGASILVDIGNLAGARSYLELALKAIQPIDSKVIKVLVYRYLSLIDSLTGKFPAAHRYFRKGYRLAKELGFQKDIINFLILHSKILNSRKRYQHGLKVAAKAVELARNLGTKDLLAEALLSKAKHEAKGGFLTSIEAFSDLRAAKEIAEKIAVPETAWKIYFEYGRFLQADKQYPEALDYYQRCTGVFKRVINLMEHEDEKHLYLKRPDRQEVFSSINKIEELLIDQ